MAINNVGDEKKCEDAKVSRKENSKKKEGTGTHSRGTGGKSKYQPRLHGLYRTGKKHTLTRGSPKNCKSLRGKGKRYFSFLIRVVDLAKHIHSHIK